MTMRGLDRETATAQPDIALARRLFDELARRTGTRKGITRASYGLGEQIAHDMVRREARSLGLDIRTDAACNLYVSLPGRTDGPGVWLGSHLDSVPLGGNYDGAAGVLAGLSVVSGFRKAGVVPPRGVTVMAIRAEESTWFNASYIGSRAAFGRLAPDELDSVTRASDGITLRAAIAAAGGDLEALGQGRPGLRPRDPGLFVETHIEQGPLLLARGIPLGIVTGIRGSFRYRHAECLGAYAHSGATPRSERQDALKAVAALIVEMDRLWDRRSAGGEDLTVTFGQIGTDPAEAAFSKVPGKVRFSVDVRSDSQATLDSVRAEMEAIIDAVSARERVRFRLGPLSTSQPAAMAPAATDALRAAAVAEAVPAITMPSGAGHDAAVFAQMGVPTAMLFLRNENGSHNPDEAMDMEDFACAARVLSRLCLDFGA